MMLWRGLKVQDILAALAAIGRRIDTNSPSEKFLNFDHDTPKSNRDSHQFSDHKLDSRPE